MDAKHLELRRRVQGGLKQGEARCPEPSGVLQSDGRNCATDSFENQAIVLVDQSVVAAIIMWTPFMWNEQFIAYEKAWSAGRRGIKKLIQQVSSSAGSTSIWRRLCLAAKQAREGSLRALSPPCRC